MKEVKAAIANQLDTAIDDSIRQKYLEAVPIGGGMQIGEKIFCLARKKRAGILTDFMRF